MTHTTDTWGAGDVYWYRLTQHDAHISSYKEKNLRKLQPGIFTFFITIVHTFTFFLSQHVTAVFMWTLALTVNGIKGNNTSEQYNSTSCVLSVIRKCKNVTDMLKDTLIKGVFCRNNLRMLSNMSRHQLPVFTKGHKRTQISWLYSHSASACRDERAWK